MLALGGEETKHLLQARQIRDGEGWQMVGEEERFQEAVGHLAVLKSEEILEDRE